MQTGACMARRSMSATATFAAATAWVLGLGLATHAAHAADGPVKYVSQQRYIKIETSATLLQHEYGKYLLSAPDFEPFSASLIGGQGEGHGIAKQTSMLTEHGMQVAGFAEGEYDLGSGGFSGKGQSIFLVVFELDEFASFHLDGTLEENGQGYLMFKFTGPSLSMVFEGPEQLVQLNETGILAPGKYELSCSAYGAGKCGSFTSCSGQGIFDFAFWIDTDFCSVDCDASGSLDISDFICFQTRFALGDPYGDCDGDGSLAIDDFICFQTLFAVGC